ncbi:hypothetical protein [Aeromicrobium sp.]|uniref:hypothetical protein n=1 Tax=Aeromicrobium sp. TaxID=1871063 RepID=UPI0028B01425|nr:hypothetical protein [Aeromicrobium sp.]
MQLPNSALATRLLALVAQFIHKDVESLELAAAPGDELLKVASPRAISSLRTKSVLYHYCEQRQHRQPHWNHDRDTTCFIAPRTHSGKNR